MGQRDTGSRIPYPPRLDEKRSVRNQDSTQHVPETAQQSTSSSTPSLARVGNERGVRSQAGTQDIQEIARRSTSSSTPSLARFTNEQRVQNQAAIQHIHGNMYFGPDRPNDSSGFTTKEKEILKSLAFPEMFQRQDGVKERHGKTCEWILELEEYRNWVNQGSGLFWIKGKPGAGKSTLMKFLYGKSKGQCRIEKSMCLEFFFSARGAKLQQTPLGMLRSLLNQLFRKDVDSRPLIREEFKERDDASGSSERKWEWQRPQLETLLSNAITQSAQRQPITVFVDALDEAGYESAHELVTYFKDLDISIKSQSARSKICISCRHYPNILTNSGTDIFVEDHNREDIRSFVQNGLRLDKGTQANSRVWESLVKELVDKAEGLFQWVCLMVPIVLRRVNDGKSLGEVRRWMQRLPTQLGETYKYILERVIVKNDLQQSLLLFQWLCLAERPLSVTEMRFAFGTKQISKSSPRLQCHETNGLIEDDESMEKQIKALSGGLAEVPNFTDQKDGVVVTIKAIFATAIPACYSAMPRDTDQSCRNFFATEGLDYSRSQPFVDYAADNLFVHAKKAGKHRAADPRKYVHSKKHRDSDLQKDIDILQKAVPGWVSYKDVNSFNSLPCPSDLLQIASFIGLTDIVQCFVKQKVDINKPPYKTPTALIYALKGIRGDQSFVSLDKTFQDLEDRDCKNIVGILLEAGAHVNVQGGSPFVPLEEASYIGDRSIVQDLLDRRADINPKFGHGFHGSALQAACKGSEEVVELLLNNGALINAQVGPNGSALQAASLKGDKEVVELLLNKKADVNAQGGYDGSALHAASAKGHKEVVELLLNEGADVNAQGGHNGSALQSASREGNKEIVKLLLGKKPDVNAQDGPHGTALQAASSRNRTEIMQLLFEAGADVNIRGRAHDTALQAASRWGYTETVQLLLDKGADINAQAGQYGSAFIAASAKGHKATVKILLKAGAKFNDADKDGRTALEAASRNGHIEIRQMLLKAGAKKTARSEDALARRQEVEKSRMKS